MFFPGNGCGMIKIHTGVGRRCWMEAGAVTKDRHVPRIRLPGPRLGGPDHAVEHLDGKRDLALLTGQRAGAQPRAALYRPIPVSTKLRRA